MHDKAVAARLFQQGLLADPIIPFPLPQIEMQVIAMGGVGSRPQHRVEDRTGAFANGHFEGGLRRILSMLADRHRRDPVARRESLVPPIDRISS